MLPRDPQVALDARVGHALALAIEAAGHGGHGGGGEILGRRHRQVQQAGRVFQNDLRRDRIVVAEVPDRARMRAVEGGEDDSRDILDMDAREDLPRLDDAPRGAGAQLLQRAASGAVDACEAEDVEGQRMVRRERTIDVRYKFLQDQARSARP